MANNYERMFAPYNAADMFNQSLATTGLSLLFNAREPMARRRGVPELLWQGYDAHRQGMRDLGQARMAGQQYEMNQAQMAADEAEQQQAAERRAYLAQYAQRLPEDQRQAAMLFPEQFGKQHIASMFPPQRTPPPGMEPTPEGGVANLEGYLAALRAQTEAKRDPPISLADITAEAQARAQGTAAGAEPTPQYSGEVYLDEKVGRWYQINPKNGKREWVPANEEFTIETMPDGTFRIRKGPAAEPITDVAKGHERFLDRVGFLQEQLTNARKAAEVGLGVRGVLGEYGDRTVGQLPEEVRDLTILGRRVGDMAGDTSGARETLGLLRRDFIELLRSDRRTLKDEYNDIKSLWPSDGMFESPERAQDVFDRIERYLADREAYSRKQLGPDGGQDLPRITSDEQWRSLPIGAEYIAEDGTRRRKTQAQ